MGYYIRQAKKMGKKLIVADPVRIPLAEIADVYLQINPGTSVALSNGMLHVIFAEGLEDKAYIEAHTEGVEELRACVEKYTPDYVADICGVQKELIVEAARLYASSKHSYIAYAMGITQHLNGTNNVMGMSNLALVTGNLGHKGSGVNPLRGQNNVQGACDMGALPTDFPAYQKVANKEVREKFEKAWGVSLSEKPGLTMTQAIPAVLEGKVKMLYIMGENPMISDPDTSHVEHALKEAFTVVQDIFLTETAEIADVVFPSCCFAEKDGTFSNTERRVQRVRQAVPKKGLAKNDWEILMELMNRLGYGCHYSCAEDIFNEIRTVTPSYAGITYARLEKEGIQWPCPNEDHPGTPILHANGPARGKGLLKTMEWEASPETTMEDYPFTVISGRILYHYHTRTMTDKTKAIHETAPSLYVDINPLDAKTYDLQDGDKVKLTSKRGAIECPVRIQDTVEPGVLFIPFHWGNGANVLADAHLLDPVSKIPGYKQIGVKLEKVM